MNLGKVLGKDSKAESRGKQKPEANFDTTDSGLRKANQDTK